MTDAQTHDQAIDETGALISNARMHLRAARVLQLQQDKPIERHDKALAWLESLLSELRTIAEISQEEEEAVAEASLLESEGLFVR